MSIFSTRLKIALANKNIRASVLAYRCGVDQATISNYLKDKYHPKYPMAKKIAEILDVSVEWLLGETTDFDVAKKQNKIIVPVLGYVAAGIPIEQISEILDYEELSAELGKDGSEFFALQIKGDSMEPRMKNGDVVVVRKQPDIDSGQIGIVCVNGDHATCKKVMKQDGGILLQPLNPAYPTVFYSMEQIEQIPITILGRVIELRAKF